MKLYLVEYCNGQSHEEYQRFVIGVYTTADKAIEAGNTTTDLNIEDGCDEGYYEIKLIEVDQRISEDIA